MLSSKLKPGVPNCEPLQKYDSFKDVSSKTGSPYSHNATLTPSTASQLSSKATLTACEWYTWSKLRNHQKLREQQCIYQDRQCLNRLPEKGKLTWHAPKAEADVLTYTKKWQFANASVQADLRPIQHKFSMKLTLQASWQLDFTL